MEREIRRGSRPRSRVDIRKTVYITLVFGASSVVQVLHDICIGAVARASNTRLKPMSNPMLPCRIFGTLISLYIAPVHSAVRMGTWVYTAVDISICILCNKLQCVWNISREVEMCSAGHVCQRVTCNLLPGKSSFPSVRRPSEWLSIITVFLLLCIIRQSINFRNDSMTTNKRAAVVNSVTQYTWTSQRL